MHVADYIMENKFEQEHSKKMMSCDFTKLPKYKDDESDVIMDDKMKLWMMRMKWISWRRKCPNAKFVLNVTKLYNLKSN